MGRSFGSIVFLAFACGLLAAPTGAAQEMGPAIQSTSFVTGDGVRLHVLEGCPRDRGAAARTEQPTVAFVPGWSMPAEIWRAQLIELGAAYCVAALDPRGQGQSDVAAGGYTIERRAEDVGEFVARYSRVVLAGWSLGALEALQYVSRYGNARLDGLVLVDISVGEDPVPPPANDFFDALKRDRRAAIEDFVRGSFRSPRDASEIAALTDAALRMPLEASLSLFPRSLPRTHWRGIARSFPKPMLYVVSDQYAEQAQNLKRNRPETRVAVFEEAGHALFVDEPAKFNAVLARFVGEVAALYRRPPRQ
jgi:microsomal epoxide hydrolase